MAFDKLGRFFGIAEDDEMNEAPYTEAEQQEEEVPQAQKNERRANVVSINSGVGATSKIITGTVYALNGEIQRVGDKIFLATPPKFETDGKIAELVEKKDKMD